MIHVRLCFGFSELLNKLYRLSILQFCSVALDVYSRFLTTKNGSSLLKVATDLIFFCVNAHSKQKEEINYF